MTNPKPTLSLQEMRDIRTARKDALLAFFRDLAIEPASVRYARFSEADAFVLTFGTDDDTGKRRTYGGTNALDCVHTVHSDGRTLSRYGMEVRDKFLRALGEIQGQEDVFVACFEIIVVDGSIRLFYNVSEEPTEVETPLGTAYAPGEMHTLESNLLFTQADLDADEKNAEQAERLFGDAPVGSSFGPAATRSSEERLVEDFRRELDSDGKQE